MLRRPSISPLFPYTTLFRSFREKGEKVIEKLLPYTGGSLRIAITGVPGAGKSTFIEALGEYLISEKKKRVAVLAIDPSSSLSGGSILGDKTRMPSLSVNKDAYVRRSEEHTSELQSRGQLV